MSIISNQLSGVKNYVESEFETKHRTGIHYSSSFRDDVDILVRKLIAESVLRYIQGRRSCYEAPDLFKNGYQRLNSSNLIQNVLSTYTDDDLEKSSEIPAILALTHDNGLDVEAENELAVDLNVSGAGDTFFSE